MKFLFATVMLVGLVCAAPTAKAQEPELVSEIVARVNNDIITRADYLNAVREFKEELTRQMQQQGKSQADIEAEFAKLKPTVLDLLIENMLLEQKAKELGFDAEAEVNERMAELAKQNGFKTALDFEKALHDQGVDPEAVRAQIRRDSQQQYVIQREVLKPIFQRLSDKDRHDFYERNKEHFTVPGEVTLSEIFVPLDSHTAAEVEPRMRRIIDELKAGLSFSEAVQKYSAQSRASRSQGGKMGAFKAGDLSPAIAAAISSLKPGEVTEPIRQPDGFQIIRLDDRKESSVKPYDSPDVQGLINRYATLERAEDARKKYLKKLREEAFVDVNKDYATTQAKTEKSDKSN
jgi:peptidyl-prolyl cis-trans isomerase SurA